MVQTLLEHSGPRFARLYRDMRRPGCLSRCRVIYKGPKDHINIRISHSGPKAQDKGDSRHHGIRGILVFMWSFGSPSNPDIIQKLSQYTAKDARHPRCLMP